MRVLVVGSGGREHALAWKLRQSPLVERIFIAPGNGGTSQVGENVRIGDTDLDELVRFAQEQRIDLTVIGPEAPLALGLADRLVSVGLPAFGPTGRAARLESSKVFAKQFMARHRIPTAEFAVVDDLESGRRAVHELGLPIAIKADGLAAGKGVVVCGTEQQAAEALQAMLVERRLGDAGHQVVVEQGLRGEEVSLLALCDGERAVPLILAQDHKAAYDGDRGPNTGGMGSYAPALLMSPGEVQTLMQSAIEPAVAGLRSDGSPFRGVLYAGLMLTSDGPRVLEFNVRFGDPETQSILPLLQTDLLELLLSCATGSLPAMPLQWRPGACVCVVIASKGYPGDYVKNVPVRGLEEAESVPNVTVFQAGTRRSGTWLVTSGGRVLGVTGYGECLSQAIQTAYGAAEAVRIDGAFYRKDIGAKALQGGPQRK